MPNPPKHICRFDFGRTHGWFLRVERPGLVVRRLFSDLSYGGKGKALLAAKLELEKLKRKMPERVRAIELPRNGRIVKTTRSYYDSKGKSRQYKCYEAQIRTEPNRQSGTSWSIDKWGQKVALANCKRWLKQAKVEQRQNYEKLQKGRK